MCLYIQFVSKCGFKAMGLVAIIHMRPAKSYVIFIRQIWHMIKQGIETVVYTMITKIRQWRNFLRPDRIGIH